MRVCFVLPGRALAPVGGYAVAYAYAAQLSRQGHEVSVLHGRAASQGDHRWKGLVAPAVYAVNRRQRPGWFELPPAVRVRNVAPLRADDIPAADVIVATGVLTAEPVALACDRLGARGIYLIQHFEDFATSPEHVWATWRLPLTRVVVSDWLQSMMEQAGLPCTLVRNGLDTSLFHPEPAHPEPAHPEPTRPEAGRAEPPTVFALVSDEPWKRTDLVCAAYQKIAAEDATVRLVTFGVCDRPAGLPSRAVHVKRPERARLAALYRQASVYVCASDAEGFGLPVAEAMASGTPVVSTDIDGVRSYAGAVPLYVPRGDADAIVAATLSLIRDPVAAGQRRAAGLRLASSMDGTAAAEKFASVCVGVASHAD